MQFWFVHSGEVSVREQIVTQITLGILSEELAAGERLPSTRELARRFHLHANTVSAAYRQLEQDGWVQARRGSGVFVRDRRPAKACAPGSSQQMLAHLFARFLQSARKVEIPLDEVRGLLSDWLLGEGASRLLLIDPREGVRAIVLAELERAVGFGVLACGEEDAAKADAHVIAVALPIQAARVRALLPSGVELVTLQLRSAAGALAGHLPVAPDALVGVASGWLQFLETTRTMLVATGIAPEAILVRHTAEPGWHVGLGETVGVVCDVVTAARMPAGVRAIPFPLLSEASLKELKGRVAAMRPEFAAGA